MASPIQEFDEIEEFDDEPQPAPNFANEFSNATLDPGYFPGLDRDARVAEMRSEVVPEEIPLGTRILSGLDTGIKQGAATPARLAHGALDLGLGATGLGDTGLANWNEDMLRQYSEREADINRRDIQTFGENDIANQLASGTGRAAVELPLMVAPGMGAATPAQAVARSALAGGAVGGGSSYAQDRGEGMDRGEAAAYAAISGTITALTTKAFGTTGVESIFRKEGIRGVRNRILDAARNAGMEMTEEGADQIQQDLLERSARNPDKPIADSLKETLMAAGVGGILGGGVTAARSAIDTGSNPALSAAADEFNRRGVGIAGLPETAPIEEFDDPMEFEALDPATGSPISTIQPLLEKADARMAQIDEQRLREAQAQPAPAEAAQVPTPEPEAPPSATPETTQFVENILNPDKKVTTNDAVGVGVALSSVTDLDAILAAREKFASELEAVKAEAKNNPQAMARYAALAVKGQIFREAVEAATNTGSHKIESRILSEKDLPEPKLDWKKNPQVAEWIKRNGAKFGIDASEVAAATPEAAPESAPEIVGMGGATPAEFGSPVPYVTSNKNAKVDEERKSRGLPPMMDTARQNNQAAWDEAMKIVDETPDVQDRLIGELVNNPRALTPVENAMVMHRRIFLRNEYEKALHRWRDMFEFGDLERAAEESQRVKDFSSQLADLESVTKATGAESGRSLQARKMMVNEDYTLAAMELAAMEAKGRNLTPEEHLELIRAREKIADLEKRLAEMDAGREAKEVDAQTSATMKDVSAEAKDEAKSKDFDIDREERLIGSIQAKIDKGQQNEITPLVQQLARVFWRRGVRGREPMIDALHEVLKSILPDFTRDDTQRAFSGYGNFKPLSKEDIDVGLRDLRGQTQQVLKLEALEARKPLEKTGQERRVPSDEERRLIKQVNELKRKYGVVVTDPATQLKSALQSRKTYYEHRISDLKHEIETRERIVKTKSPSPTDPELDALRAEHDRLKQEHDSVFPAREITDEQRIKLAIAAAERNQAHWESRLENAEKGVFGVTRTTKPTVTSAELETIKAETQAVKDHIQELKDLDGALLAEKREASLARQKATLEKEIAEQERKLREGDLKSPDKPMNRPADPALEELKQKRDALNKKLEEARKKPEAQKYAEAQQRELERLNKAISEREAKVAAGDLSSSAPPKKINRPLPPELEQARQKLEAVNKQLADMRKAARPVKTKEEIALQSLKTRMATRTAELRDRIARKDFVKKERKPTALDAEGNKLKAELDAAKEEFNTRLEQDRWAKMSVFDKTRRKIADVYDAARALMTTGEFSFILRQAKLPVLSRPIQSAKALPDMFRALLGSEQKAHEIDLAVHNHPDAPAARAAKLAIIEEGVSLHKQEEILMGRWVGKIPIVKNFNRAAQVFLNRVRFDTWQALRKSLTKSGTPTPEEDKQIAMFVNEATGRGGLGKLEPAAVPLARVMFSPRYYASRLQLAAGHSLWGGTGRTRRIIATEYARSLIGLGIYYTMLSAMFSGGDDEDKKRGSIETDPRSTDFGKVNVGKTRLDPLAGLSQVIVLASRTATGEKTTGSGKVVPIRGKEVKFGGDQWSDIMARHLRGKLHPVPASVANLFDGTDLGGDEATLINQSQNLIAPITYIDIYSALKEQDLTDGVALALLALLGEGVQTYEKKK